MSGFYLDTKGVERLHELKTWPAEFQAIAEGRKTFDLRKNDRDYQTGDNLLLREFDPVTQTYSGRYVLANVTYILHGGSYGLPEDLCIMSIKWAAQGGEK